MVILKQATILRQTQSGAPRLVANKKKGETEASKDGIGMVHIREFPGFRVAPEPATVGSFLYTDMWSPPCFINSQT